MGSPTFLANATLAVNGVPRRCQVMWPWRWTDSLEREQESHLRYLQEDDEVNDADGVRVRVDTVAHMLDVRHLCEIAGTDETLELSQKTGTRLVHVVRADPFGVYGNWLQTVDLKFVTAKRS